MSPKAEMEADIARMLANYRNRKRLGFSYYETTGRSGAMPVDLALNRQRGTARQAALRARRLALRGEPGS